MESLNDPLLIFWRAFGDWGLIVVIVAVVLEVSAAASGSILEKWKIINFKQWESRLKRYEVMAGWILVVGLAMEYKGHREETIILDFNNAVLYDDAKQAEKKAGDAFKLEAIANARASEFDAARAKFEYEAELTHSNNLVLQLKLQPRTITQKQIDDFIFLTEKVTKIPIKISLPSGSQETVNYAYQIRDMLNLAGFFAETNSGPWGINLDPTAMIHKTGRGDASWTDVIFYAFSTNETFIIQQFQFESTNGFARPIVTETNNEIIGSAIMFAFNQIGIKTIESVTSTWVSKGGIEFFIMDKAN